MPAKCVTSDTEDMVVACPGCDAAGGVYPNTRSGGYYCNLCGENFEEYNEREAKQPGHGNAKYADLSLEDVGLDPMET